MLNNDQERAKSGLTQYLDNPSQGRWALLKGYAGTGKTYLMKELLQGRSSILVVAPTHKAVKVIRKSMKPVNAVFMTIHAALRIKPVQRPDGTQKFEQDKFGSDKGVPFEDFKIIIFDEVSMCEDEITKLIDNHFDDHQWLIMMGDEAQLPPVGHKGDKLAKPFRTKPSGNPEIEGMHVFALKEIMRQDPSNPIRIYAQSFREQHELPVSQVLGKHITRIDRSEIMKTVIPIFQSEEYKEDRDRIKILAYTNQMVDSYNFAIHKKLYPDATYILAEGEQIILQAPYPLAGFKGRSLQNAEEFIVEELGPPIRKDDLRAPDDIPMVERDYPGKVFIAKCSDINGLMQPIVIAQSPDTWKYWLAQMRNSITESKSYNKRELWKQWYWLKDQVADWKYGYAVTIHKSQGSTYKQVFLDKADVDACRKPLYWRLTYTAVTRPSDELTIVQG